MFEKNKKVYFCSFCRKHYLIKNRCLNHQDICSKNPINRHCCYDCIHFKSKQDCFTFDNYDGTEIVKKFKSFYCDKLKCFLYSRKAKIKNYDFTNGGTNEIYQQMKNKCEFYKVESYFEK